MPKDLRYRGRKAFARGAWGEAYACLSQSVDNTLPPDDLELLAMSAYLGDGSNAYQDLWTRAYNSFLDEHNIPGAVRCAFWLGFILSSKGERVRGGSWIGLARQLLDDHPMDCVEEGYLFLPVALKCLGAGDVQGSIEAFDQAKRIGNRFKDEDLLALAQLGHGQALIRAGEPERGVASLDKAMIAVESQRLAPMVMGIIYCAVIETCLEIFDLTRALEWTNALGHWCASHPQLVPFRGQCLARRSEILRLHGAWDEAMREAAHAIDRLSQPMPESAAGAVFYQLGDLCRLQGDYVKAEEAYREANKLGRTPQPGLALLRLAQGNTGKAKASISHAVEAFRRLSNKCDVLFARVEIMLAADDTGEARSTLQALRQILQPHEPPLLSAVLAQAEGAVLLAEGQYEFAAERLTHARSLWEELKVPYELARTRALLARAYRATGDEDSAQLEYHGARSIFHQLNAMPDVDSLERHFSADVSHSGKDLSRREKEVLHLMTDGKSNKAIAHALFISERTVERHVSNIFVKLDVSSRTEAASFAFRHKLF